MDPRKNPQVVVDLHRLLQSLSERTAALLTSLESWDPLHKPVRDIDDQVRKVVPLVRSLLPQPDVASVAYDTGHFFTAAPKRANILYIDDNPDRLMLLRSVLEMKGYAVHIADHGRKGLELFLSEPIDLVILDFHMPGMNGDAVAGKMRKLRPTIPILIFSGSLTLPDKIIATVDGFISTSEEPEVLLERIGSLLGRMTARAS
jgi:CheY-like chemotaxis protein